MAQVSPPALAKMSDMEVNGTVTGRAYSPNAQDWCGQKGWDIFCTQHAERLGIKLQIEFPPGKHKRLEAYWNGHATYVPLADWNVERFAWNIVPSEIKTAHEALAMRQAIEVIVALEEAGYEASKVATDIEGLNYSTAAIALFPQDK